MHNFDAHLKALAKKGCKTAEDMDIDDYIELVELYLETNVTTKFIKEDLEKIINELKDNPQQEKTLRIMTQDISNLINEKLLRLRKRSRAERRREISA